MYERLRFAYYGVAHAHISSQRDQHWLKEEHFEWPCESLLDLLRETDGFSFHWRIIALVPCLFAHKLRFFD
jgi:hypothetical protein